MIDPIQTLKDYDRFRYSKDAAGHEHSAENGQFTSGGSGGTKTKSEHAAHTLASHLTSEKLHDPHEFRAAYSDLEDHEKMEITKHLAKRGLIHPVDAKKRKPMTASEIISSARGQYKQAKESHESKPTNRHELFADSAEHKKMRGE